MMRCTLIRLLVFLGSLAVGSASAELALSEEGKEQKALHDFLFDDFLAGKHTVFRGEGRDRGLKELVVLKKSLEIADGDEIELPLGSGRVAMFFRHFGFHGENLDKIKEVRVLPFSPDRAPPRSVQVEKFYRVQMPSLPLMDEMPAGLTLKILMKDGMTCRIDDVVFYAQAPIPKEFDTIPFVDLGSDRPREQVVIEVDLENELVVGGTSDLQREKWFRMHQSPGEVDPSLERWALERNFSAGRSAFKFNPAITRGWGNMKTLKEREDRPGAADLEFFATYDSGKNLREGLAEFHRDGYAMTFNDWPEFMSVPLVGRGTPLVERFDEAAELAAAYVEDQIRDAGTTATWWEVKNESSVKSEWAHHFEQGKDGWGLLADFHNRMADAIHARAPGTKVGGPSSAYMQVQVKDFSIYQSQARFIEETKGHLDFFSHHFYENAGMLGAHERRGNGYSNYLLGRYEAILDMLRAQMHKVDNVLPILITEAGSLQNGRNPSSNWLRLLAWNAFLNKSMQRPDQIDLFVPFIFLEMHWNPISGDAAFTPKAGVKRARKLEDFEPTKTAKYFELWRDFDGVRLPVSFERDWLDVTAIHDGNRISLAVTNMGGRQIALDLSGLAEKSGATGALQTRLNYHKGEVVFEPEHAVEVTAIPVDVNETTVIRLTLPEPLAPAGKLRMERWYSPETAVKSTGGVSSFKVQVGKPQAVASAKFVLGLHRGGGMSEPVSVTLNGTPVPLPLGDADEFSEFFAPIGVSVPVDLLKKENVIEIQAQAGTTMTSVQLVTVSKSK